MLITEVKILISNCEFSLFYSSEREEGSYLGVEEASKVDLHDFWVWSICFFELIDSFISGANFTQNSMLLLLLKIEFEP